MRAIFNCPFNRCAAAKEFKHYGKLLDCGQQRINNKISQQ